MNAPTEKTVPGAPDLPTPMARTAVEVYAAYIADLVIPPGTERTLNHKQLAKVIHQAILWHRQAFDLQGKKDPGGSRHAP